MAFKNLIFSSIYGIIDIDLGKRKKKYLEVKNMYNEETFNFNIENIQNDLAIEGMAITQNDVEMFRRFANDEVAMPELIQMIKDKPLEY